VCGNNDAGAIAMGTREPFGHIADRTGVEVGLWFVDQVENRVSARRRWDQPAAACAVLYPIGQGLGCCGAVTRPE